MSTALKRPYYSLWCATASVWICIIRWFPALKWQLEAGDPYAASFVKCKYWSVLSHARSRTHLREEAAAVWPTIWPLIEFSAFLYLVLHVWIKSWGMWDWCYFCVLSMVSSSRIKQYFHPPHMQMNPKYSTKDLFPLLFTIYYIVKKSQLYEALNKFKTPFLLSIMLPSKILCLGQI